jgi:RimJ/RimL family protein N-acetyltransferase
MVETIRTGRLTLRPLRASDAGPITLHASDLRLARMTALIPHPYPPGAAQAFIEATLSGRRDEEVWAIDATPAGGEELVGIVGFRPAHDDPADESHGGELGYWVGPPYWNAGYATEAVTALVAHLFGPRGIAALEAPVFADNLPSAAVLAKAGFRETGATRIYSVARGEEVPSRVFRLDRGNWSEPADGGERGPGR